MSARLPLLVVLLLPVGGCATFTTVGGTASPTPTISPTPTGTNTPTPTPTPGVYLRPGQHGIAAGVNAATVSFPLATTSGDLLVVAVELPQGATLTGVSDDGGDGFVQADMAASPGGDQLWIYYAKDVAPGTVHVKASFLIGMAGTVAAAEVGGASRTAPFDAAVHQNGSGITADSGSLVPAGAGELLFAAAFSEGMPGSTTAGGGYTLLDKMNGLADEYRIDAATGGASATFDYNVSEAWVCSMATFRQ